ncbi:MAG TPA: hypothetical protein VFU29_05960, partial [Chitinophagaceae bacterium]|nr:hypothetical protein [Chitinophagaceae bacterium]
HMKKLLTLTTMLFVCILMNAQTPQGLNYQAVARTADGVIIPTQNIGVRFSILEGSVTGAVVYSETHTVVTNSYGLFTLAIGKGIPVASTFANINWASGTDKFLKVEIAPAGGSNYQLQGTTQLLSVPYALYSEKTRLLAGNNTINITNGNTITGNYQAANNTILLTGNAIAGNYQAANNTILLSGNTIAGNYQAGNNTVLLNGNTIAGNYQAGTGINIAGNIISHNLVAGAGINITGNTITNTGTNQWLPHANGIYYNAGHVGIGTTPQQYIGLTIQAVNADNTGHGALDLHTTDTWHNAIGISNNLNQQFSLVLTGSTNTDAPPGTFGIFNSSGIPAWNISINRTTNNIAIGSLGFVSNVPKSRLHVFNGDVNIEQIGSGIIMKSPNGQCWRITIDNAGNLVRTAIVCP